MTIYKIRILYKSGNSFESWFQEFEIERGDYTWKTTPGSPKPLILGVDNIEAVWIVEEKEVQQ